jgi:hypothetical protein
MEKINRISREELIHFFHHHNYHVENREKIVFDLRLPGRMIVSCQLDVIEKEKYSIQLQTEYKILKQFIVDNKVQSVQDLQKITRDELWVRYLRSKGQVCVHIHQYNTAIIFTVTNKARTVIRSEDCGFACVIDKMLSMDGEFEEYVRDCSFEPTRRVGGERHFSDCGRD